MAKRTIRFWSTHMVINNSKQPNQLLDMIGINYMYCNFTSTIIAYLWLFFTVAKSPPFHFLPVFSGVKSTHQSPPPLSLYRLVGTLSTQIYNKQELLRVILKRNTFQGILQTQVFYNDT